MLTRRGHRMTCSELLFLVNERDFGNRFFDLLRRMADYNENIGGHGAGSAQYMLDEVSSAGTVKDLRVFGFHAGTLPRSEDQDSKIVHGG